jgi:hypothetical protein
VAVHGHYLVRLVAEPLLIKLLLDRQVMALGEWTRLRVQAKEATWFRVHRVGKSCICSSSSSTTICAVGWKFLTRRRGRGASLESIQNLRCGDWSGAKPIQRRTAFCSFIPGGITGKSICYVGSGDPSHRALWSHTALLVLFGPAKVGADGKVAEFRTVDDTFDGGIPFVEATERTNERTSVDIFRCPRVSEHRSASVPRVCCCDAQHTARRQSIGKTTAWGVLTCHAATSRKTTDRRTQKQASLRGHAEEPLFSAAATKPSAGRSRTIGAVPRDRVPASPARV